MACGLWLAAALLPYCLAALPRAMTASASSNPGVDEGALGVADPDHCLAPTFILPIQRPTTNNFNFINVKKRRRRGKCRQNNEESEEAEKVDPGELSELRSTQLPDHGTGKQQYSFHHYILLLFLPCNLITTAGASCGDPVVGP